MENYNLTFDGDEEEKLHKIAKRGFIEFFDNKPERLEQKLCSMSKDELDNLINAIVMEYMIAKYKNYTLDTISDQAFAFAKSQLNEVIRERGNADWLPFKEWSKNLVDMVVNVIYKNFEFLYIELRK